MRQILLSVGIVVAACVFFMPRVVAIEEPGKDGPPAHPAFSHGRPQGNAPDLMELFEKFDADKDGTLTPDEFTEGMNQLHRRMMEHARPMTGRMSEPMPFGPPTPRMMQCPPDAGCPHDRPFGHNPPPDFRRDGNSLEERLEELEAKVTSLEAKLEGK